MTKLGRLGLPRPACQICGKPVKDRRNRFCSNACSGVLRSAKATDPAKRFWTLADTSSPDGCWPWHAAIDKDGYGRFELPGHRQATVHRFAYELAIGPIPEGRSVLHHCDNRSCVRPDHLFVGTHTDNMQDAKRKGRKYGRHPAHAKLTAEQVHVIREDLRKGISPRSLASQYHVCVGTIYFIREGATWRTVD